jgi:hypothetical protein
MVPMQEQSSSIVAELSSIIALEAIYALLLIYRDRMWSSWITKMSYLLFIVSAAGLLASTWTLRAKPDGEVNSGSKCRDTNRLADGLIIATIVLQYSTVLFQQIRIVSYHPVF